MFEHALGDGGAAIGQRESRMFAGCKDATEFIGDLRSQFQQRAHVVFIDPVDRGWVIAVIAALRGALVSSEFSPT